MAEIRGNFGSLPEAEAYFRQKVNLPTRRWDELRQGQHARAFVVAGATRDALLTDLREAVDAAISKGETLDDFRARFRDIVKRNGWTGWTGEGTAKGVAWRTAVIYQTNLSTAYHAGRWETLKHFPYLRYKHNPSRNPREQHVAWDGTILPTNDPWWKTHYTPNGWFCHCKVFGVSDAKMRAMGWKVSPRPPDIAGDPPPEWAYHVGHASTGQQLSQQDMQYWRDQKGDAWEVLTPKTAAEYGRPEQVPLDALPHALADVRHADPERLHELITAALGADERVFRLPIRDDFSFDMVASAETLAQHVDGSRAAYVPLLPDVLSDPFEVWQSFERHQGTGKIELRTRYVRAFDIPKKPGVLVVFSAVKGHIVSWTMVPTKPGYLDRQRYGALLYARPAENGT